MNEKEIGFTSCANCSERDRALLVNYCDFHELHLCKTCRCPSCELFEEMHPDPGEK